MSDISKLDGFSIGFETSGADQHNYRFPEQTTINGFSVGFEMNEGDKRFLESTTIYGFSIGFEYHQLRVDSILEQRL